MVAHYQQNDSIADKIQPVPGAIAGVAAYVVGYFVTLILIAVAEGDDLGDDLIEGSGQVFYNAMFVDVDVSDDAPAFYDSSINFLTMDGASELFSLPTVIYHLIPILALVGAGVFLALTAEAKDPIDGALAGVSLVVGFVVLALLGTFLFSNDIGSPDLITGVILAGVVYPAVFGAIGGAIGSKL